jgi:S1-C subfamily serine protease
VKLRRRVLVALSAPLAAGAVAAALVAGTATGSGSSSPVGTGVVTVQTNLRFANASAAGTGMVLTSSGQVLTNNHVIRGATTIRVTVPSTGRTYPARVLGYSLAADVAVLKLQGASGLRTVTLGDSSTVRVGQAATAVGNSGGTGTLTSTVGTITAVGRTITVRDDQGATARLTGLIGTDAFLQPGDSGGPLLNADGKVIGMNTAADARFVFRPARSEGYAIPINRAAAIARQIEAGRSSATVHVGPTAFLGVALAPPNSAGASTAGGLVTGVVSGSPADRAGLVPGDVIVSLDGRAARSPAALVNLLLGKRPGDRVALAWVDRLGSRHTATVTLASGPPQ